MANSQVIRNMEEEPFKMADNRVLYIEEEPFKTANLRVIRDRGEESSDEEMEEPNRSRSVSPADMETKHVVGPKSLQEPNLGNAGKTTQTKRTPKGSASDVVGTVGKGPVVEAETEDSITDEKRAHSAVPKVAVSKVGARPRIMSLL